MADELEGLPTDQSGVSQAEKRMVDLLFKGGASRRLRRQDSDGGAGGGAGAGGGWLLDPTWRTVATATAIFLVVSSPQAGHVIRSVMAGCMSAAGGRRRGGRGTTTSDAVSVVSSDASSAAPGSGGGGADYAVLVTRAVVFAGALYNALDASASRCFALRSRIHRVACRSKSAAESRRTVGLRSRRSRAIRQARARCALTSGSRRRIRR